MKRQGTGSFILFSNTGCLLPFLLVSNLLFGWIFLGLLKWALLETVLMVLFLFSSFTVAKRIFSSSGPPDGVIDTEGEVLEEQKRLKSVD